MAGIYQRDNLAQIYAANLERALARRDAYEQERAARVKSNVDAIKNGIRAVGTAVTYGMSEDPQVRLAALEKEYQEALAAEREAIAADREQYNNGVREAVGANVPTYSSNPYLNGMEGYRPNPNLGGYSDYMGRNASADYDLARLAAFYRRGL